MWRSQTPRRHLGHRSRSASADSDALSARARSTSAGRRSLRKAKQCRLLAAEFLDSDPRAAEALQAHATAAEHSGEGPEPESGDAHLSLEEHIKSLRLRLKASEEKVSTLPSAEADAITAVEFQQNRLSAIRRDLEANNLGRWKR